MLSNNLNKEKFYMEESEKEVLGQQIIEEWAVQAIFSMTLYNKTLPCFFRFPGE